jgi:hypothetical protein
MLQATILDSEIIDPFPLIHNVLSSFIVDICWCEIAKALVQTPVVVVFNEGCDLLIEFSRKIIVIENAVLQRLIPALNPPLYLRMTDWEPSSFL